MRIYSWNVNGLRACLRKGFETWMDEESQGAIFGLQEVRASVDQLPASFLARDDLFTHVVAGSKQGYSGVAIVSKRPADRAIGGMGAPQFDLEGRVQFAYFGKLVLVNAYFPNGNRDLSRVPYKLRFYDHFRQILHQHIEDGDRVLVMGDFNTAHTELDLARPKQNVQNTGFLPEERESFELWLEAGWVDTFRHFHPEETGHYTWWSQRTGARKRNVGWRIDYILASPAAMPFVEAASIHPEVHGSDHCPVSVDVDPAIFE